MLRKCILVMSLLLIPLAVASSDPRLREAVDPETVYACPLFILYEESPGIYCYLCDGMDEDCNFVDVCLYYFEYTEMSGCPDNCFFSFRAAHKNVQGPDRSLVFDKQGRFRLDEKAKSRDAGLTPWKGGELPRGVTHFVKLEQGGVEAFFRVSAVTGWRNSQDHEFRLVGVEVPAAEVHAHQLTALKPERTSRISNDPRLWRSRLSVPGYDIPVILLRTRN